ncbi:MAG: hypothetical protein FWD76_02000 [Firmicutes bacterium]|nr:hypothetical protein [Bacillota bacterium]
MAKKETIGDKDAGKQAKPIDKAAAKVMSGKEADTAIVSKKEVKQAKVQAKLEKKAVKQEEVVSEKPVYVMCPRCELNFIEKKAGMCNVCKVENGLLDRSFLMPDDDDGGIEKICPACKINYIGEDEEICFLCEKEKQDKMQTTAENDEWVSDEMPDEPLPQGELEISLSDLEDEEKFEDEPDDSPSPVDDFEYVNPDDFDDDDMDSDDEE